MTPSPPELPAPAAPRCDFDRPRERLRSLGPRGLTVSELLAILVGSGTSGRSAVDIAHAISRDMAGSLQRLAALDVSELEHMPGVGRATAARIVAALELGRRAATQTQSDSDRIRGPADVFRRMGPRLHDLPQEEFHTLLLNARHRVLREVFVTRGILDASLIHPREVFRPAVGEGAAALILVHNHPSGDPTPSAEDRAVTRQLVDAGRVLGIPVLDHVVVGRGSYRSLMEREDG
ncbi:MAG: DNA repair protein RadC [Gemmatimonadetes bacterium]|nr:DNA repair protein RadC [Gemmatimonadota bacterium]